MPRQRLYMVWFTKSLPPDSEIARVMGRVFVLRADALVENRGLVPDTPLDALDLLHKDYRLLFFLRANARTLYSGQRVLNRLAGLPIFKAWLKDTEPAQRAQWLENKARVDATMPLIKELRNDIGAHAEESLEQAIAEMGPKVFGWIGMDSKVGLLPRLAREIVISAVMKGVALEGPAFMDEFGRRISEMSTATGSFMRATNVALDLYQERHGGLWPTRR